MTELSALQVRLQRHGQSHLLRWWDQLSPQQQSSLREQIESLDLELVDQLFHQKEADEVSPSQRAAQATPPAQLVTQPKTAAEHAVWKRAAAQGEEQLKLGRVGAILVAGGQGSRLGFDKPKGMFPVGPVSNRSLFQIFCEQLLARSRQAGAVIPYFIMTSDATHDDTVDFFTEHNFFGLRSQDVYFFRQGKLPAVDDKTGQILLSEKHEIALSPDGHGGLLKALRTAGLMEVMRDRGIETLYSHQVDNPTAIVVDPAFIGLHLMNASDISTKVVNKVSAEEKMGVLVSIGGQTQIIEYSDMPVARTKELEPDGTLRFRAGNTAMHVIRRSFLQELIDQGRDLPYHRAHKPVAHISAEGQRVQPEPSAKNAYKFEQFIFDTLPMAKSALVVEADRTREFNPVKNQSGADSPETSRAALCRIHREWLRDAGYQVADDARVEVSPLVDPESLKKSHAPGAVIADGTVIAT
jgi:UDP-N-acetylglucosamine/UDP-N-acetylgalactosamine diphosphorylase